MVGKVAKRQEPEDRISKLPDELLCRILSELDSCEAVQTCVLSKRWVNIWTTLPCLNYAPKERIGDVYYCKHFVKKFLKYRNQQSVITTFNVDCQFFYMRILKYALAYNVENLRIRNEHYRGSTCLNSAFIKTLHLTLCREVNPMDWNLPNLTYLYLENVKFGTQISGFDNLKELTLAGFFEIFYGLEIYTINCPNLESLTLGPDHRYCTFVVSAPKLLYFEFRSTHVPDFCAGDGFPLVKEVDIDIQIEDYDWEFYDDDRIKFTMQNHIKMLNAVRGTPLLKLSSETIEFLRRIPEFSGYQPSPLDNLKFLSLRGLDDMPTRSTDHVISYLLSNSPSADILKGNVGASQKLENERMYL
ncbi:hypothetical protein POM88_028853 [Heracleum sosnowskyi]|uniref:F-box domain-containing protein n=1 Tax=Heracleum sosnowskyi TaxID=360622 RepID=A0AAD8MED4_9APIA|nr:hypothetical protein POM88_028853 [Heracleum sosnowskyi]